VFGLFTWVLETLMSWMDAINATGFGTAINSFNADLNETDPTQSMPQLMPRSASQSNGEQIMSSVNGTIVIENQSGMAVGAHSGTEGMSFEVMGGRSGDFN
jgi:hypothetical protein